MDALASCWLMEDKAPDAAAAVVDPVVVPVAGLERTELPVRAMAPCRTSFAVAAAADDAASAASCAEAVFEVAQAV